MRIWLNNASMRLTIVRVQRLALTMRIDTSLYDLCFQWLHIDNTHIIYPTKLKALFPKIIKKKSTFKVDDSDSAYGITSYVIEYMNCS